MKVIKIEVYPDSSDNINFYSCCMFFNIGSALAVDILRETIAKSSIHFPGVEIIIMDKNRSWHYDKTSPLAS